MGSWGFLWFGDEDKVLIEEIAKLHKLDIDVVEQYYKEFINKCLKEQDSNSD